ncbi:ATP-NAD kinase [Idiomarina sp. WRN-38]|uniref:ATP-NAD kinase family protein n=1 Tax=Idiomarina sp. OXR-189 TaxID=3100175 RepID=UPI0007335E59|nr:ATP-NAD kinase family protein [Idiomarina sp. OXR-189]KTG23965.1 ATP-NAD kinase [Idiomarina sp. H105]OAE91356.1 ATP-NAD kinase [Idiomarina sp. WRN-38]WPZ02313.1 ATP-NAD kinase family protein [Idiomarina sp. OXR-189]
MTAVNRLTVGLVVNPYAGIGGAIALKGSDGADIREKALKAGAERKAMQRAETALKILQNYQKQLDFVTCGGEMGENVLKSLGFSYQTVFNPNTQETSSDDTKQAVKAIIDKNVDILLFAGGDGTARDVYSVVPDNQLVLGIPAGVKIHSGVYAISPTAAGRVIEKILKGELSSIHESDVMDIDESAFREGIVKARRYGEMSVPAELEYVQAVKMGGKESDELVLDDIAAEIIERVDDELLVMGSGSTVAAIMDDMGIENTLLGVDLVQDDALIKSDITEKELFEAVSKSVGSVKLIITLIGGQGHLFGRGNQQLSPRVIRAIGKDNIWVVATKAKLKSLNNQPLRVDTGDSELDNELSGTIRVITGYHDEVLMPVAAVS